MSSISFFSLFSVQVRGGLRAPAGHERSAGVRGGSPPSGRPAAVAPEARCRLEQTPGDVGEPEGGSSPGSHLPPFPARCQTGRILPQQPGETGKRRGGGGRLRGALFLLF